MTDHSLSYISSVDRDIITQVRNATANLPAGASHELRQPLSFYSLDGIWALSSIREVRHDEHANTMVLIGNGTVTWHESSSSRDRPAAETSYKLVIDLDLRPQAMKGSIAYKAS